MARTVEASNVSPGIQKCSKLHHQSEFFFVLLGQAITTEFSHIIHVDYIHMEQFSP